MNERKVQGLAWSAKEFNFLGKDHMVDRNTKKSHERRQLGRTCVIRTEASVSDLPWCLMQAQFIKYLNE